MQWNDENSLDVWKAAVLLVPTENIRCIDIETTGVCYGDEILSLTIIDGKGQVLYDSLFRPSHKRKWAEAQRINKISPEMVKNMPHFKDCISDIQKVLEGTRLYLSYNGEGFDLPFMEEKGVLLPDAPSCDVMLTFNRIYGEWCECFNDYKWQKLSTCVRYFGDTEFAKKYKAHGSLADAQATLYCFNKIAEMQPMKEMDKHEE